MPAVYAHDRFGQDVIAQIEGTIKELIEVERLPFDLGLQGPDFLFYFNPLVPNNMARKGGRIHNLSGKAFFHRCAKVQRGMGEDAMLAYLLGLVCHYTLDAMLHPAIELRCEEPDVIHSEVEASFDRMLMVKDGLNPLEVALGANLDSDRLGDYSEGISLFYPGTSPWHVEKSFGNLVWFQKVILVPKEAKRTFFQALAAPLGAKGRDALGHIMTREPNPVLKQTDETLFELYGQALDAVEDYMEELLLHIYQKKPLGDFFDRDFLGRS